jgi:hypothetical protein
MSRRPTEPGCGQPPNSASCLGDEAAFHPFIQSWSLINGREQHCSRVKEVDDSNEAKTPTLTVAKELPAIAMKSARVRLLGVF